MNGTTAVVLAAGLGTRMCSDTAKVLHRIGGRSIAAWVLGALRSAGVERNVVVVGHQAEKVRAELEAPDVDFALQAEQKGTGHAVQCAGDLLPAGAETVVVTVGDAPLVRSETYGSLLAHHVRSDASATVLTTIMPDPTGYGRVLRHGDGRVSKIVEHRDATLEEREVGEINSGIYAFRASALTEALAHLRANNDQGELYLTDTLEILGQRGGRLEAVLTEDPHEVMGINTRAQLAEAGTLLLDRHLARLMDGGVTLELPRATYIEPGVTVGRETVVEPFCHLSGSTRVGEGCRIGAGAVLRDVVISDGMVIAPGAQRNGDGPGRGR